MPTDTEAVFDIPLGETPDAPILSITRARRPATQTTTVIAHDGQTRAVEVPGEHALTVYLDKQEVVTLMTLGQAPEALVMGYLRNQRLVNDLAELAAVHVDWATGACAVATRSGVDVATLTAKRTITTGCGQGTMFGDWLDTLEPIHSDATVSVETLDAALGRILALDTIYKRSGSVHGCALLRNTDEAPLLYHVEDVGRHNAVDAISGFMWLDEETGPDKIFYTTGRLTSEMVMKAVQMRVPFLVSRSGLTQMGLAMAQEMGVTLVCRARVGRHLVYSHPERITRGA
ncbi:formate dehydrogenase accessory sulfurtransferase FdhD [Nitrogeniibacter mangrovi]|uniref:Sulfur carrier protein FdhD n=1 Tax=Nitrogeniibacter mangrovi TaxID=2016596 RepID=A0A6C1AYV9_9RHOO|nr:formate dehydrogenase accessory sulfurtransferase FdhD [Nitrogeniibacter mangrovi]QID16323.1 formate dehydrogenase accessory sulfurtransferase FdhD [Nitrogeniibacter mangrovi]